MASHGFCDVLKLLSDIVVGLSVSWLLSGNVVHLWFSENWWCHDCWVDHLWKTTPLAGRIIIYYIMNEWYWKQMIAIYSNSNDSDWCVIQNECNIFVWHVWDYDYLWLNIVKNWQQWYIILTVIHHVWLLYWWGFIILYDIIWYFHKMMFKTTNQYQ